MLDTKLGLALDRLPRVSLVDLPTRLEECPRLSRALGGPRILIKRDDLTGLAMGGSKSRRLEYVLGDALASGADTVLLAGRIQSNHARQLSAGAAKLGLSLHLLLTVLETDDPVPQSNLLLDDLLGANITLIGPEDIHRRDEILQAMVERARENGQAPYVMNSSRAKLLGGAGQVAGAVELNAQLQAMDVVADYVWMASAGDTHVGHMVVAKALATGWKVMAQSYDPMPEEDEIEQRRRSMATSAVELSKLLGLNLTFSSKDVNYPGESVTGIFAEATPSSVEAVRLVARTEGVLLDPLHTGRAMASLVSQIRSGNIGQGETVVFLHTGGTPNIFGFGEQLASRKWPVWAPDTVKVV